MQILSFTLPVQQTELYLKELPNYQTQSHLIVTDTGSTKSNIQSYEKFLLNNDIHLVGGHPMAGSHKSGVLNSKNIYSKMLITFSFMMMHVMLNRLKVTNIVINYICKIYNNISTRARLCYWSCESYSPYHRFKLSSFE